MTDRVAVEIDDVPFMAGPTRRLLIQVRLRVGNAYAVIAKAVVPRYAHLDVVDRLLEPGLDEAAALLMDGYYAT